MRVLYFAWLRERVGTAEETVEPPEAVETVADLVAWLRDRSPAHAEALGDERVVRCAVDQDHAHFADSVRGAGEVAFFPPVTGG